MWYHHSFYFLKLKKKIKSRLKQKPLDLSSWSNFIYQINFHVYEISSYASIKASFLKLFPETWREFSTVRSWHWKAIFGQKATEKQQHLTQSSLGIWAEAKKSLLTQRLLARNSPVLLLPSAPSLSPQLLYSSYHWKNDVSEKKKIMLLSLLPHSAAAAG